MSGSAEASIRLGVMVSVLVAMAVWEIVAPRRRLTVAKTPRWASNLGLVVLNTIVARLAVPVTAVTLADITQARSWGLFALVDWPAWLEVALAVAVLDLAIYLQHVMFHAVPLFWRLHLVHHADLDFDVTTGLRFHTVEILLSALIKLGAVAALGPSALAVLIFEVVLNATAMFNHSNARIPIAVDRWLRLLVVTPDMHRVHHSTVPAETNSNFGFNLPWWDFLLGTYRAQPSREHATMEIGLPEVRDEQTADRLPSMLLLPLRWRGR